MSGGHWGYAGYKFQEKLEEMAQDEDVQKRWPLLAAVLAELGPYLYKLEHEMDWDLSGDSSVCQKADFEPDDEKFQVQQYLKLMTIVLTAPDELNLKLVQLIQEARDENAKT